MFQIFLKLTFQTLHFSRNSTKYLCKIIKKQKVNSQGKESADGNLMSTGKMTGGFDGAAGLT